MNPQKIINYFRDIRIVHLGLFDWLKRHGVKFLIAILILSVVYLALKNYFSPQVKTIMVGNTKVEVEVVKTTAEREQGLSGRESLCQNCGMLFVYSQPGFHSIWMKEMKFDVDIIWISSNKIIGFTPKVPYPAPKATYFPTYQPPQPANAVLEVPAGWTSRHGIRVGDMVK